MSSEKVMRYTGMALSALVAIAMVLDGLVGLFRPQLFSAEMAADGWGPQTLFPVACMAFICGVLYMIPRTAVLGTILITGFVGGAIAVHLRVTQTIIAPEIINILLGAGAWGGIWLRDPRLRTLLPLR